MNKYMQLIHGYDIYKNFDYKKYSHRLFGWNINPKLYEEYIAAIKPQLILELGTWLGGSAISMAKIIREKNLHTKIICIDTWLGSLEFMGLHEVDQDRALLPVNGYPTIYNQFLANVVYENLQDIIIPLPNTFKNSCHWLDLHDIYADLIYIDGDNLLDSVYNDVNDAWPVLANNGIMFGDDFETVQFPGIRLALNKFCVEHQLTVKSPDNHPNFWNIKKNHH